MKKTQNRKIMAALKDLEAGMTMREVAEKYGTTHGTISKWKLKYGTKTQKMTKNIPFGSVPETLVPSCDTLVPSSNTLVPSCDTLVPSSNENIPSEDDYDYDDEANDLLEEYFKTHDRNDVSGIYFDENGKLKLKKAMKLTEEV